MNKIINWLMSLSADKYLLFILGMLAAAIFAIPFGMRFCFWPVIFVAAIFEFVRLWRGETWNWWEFFNILIGALPIQLLATL